MSDSYRIVPLFLLVFLPKLILETFHFQGEALAVILSWYVFVHMPHRQWIMKKESLVGGHSSLGILLKNKWGPARKRTWKLDPLQCTPQKTCWNSFILFVMFLQILPLQTLSQFPPESSFPRVQLLWLFLLASPRASESVDLIVHVIVL